MKNCLTKVPFPVNEPVLTYKKGSKELKNVLRTYREMHRNRVDIFSCVGNKKIKTGHTVAISPPHEHKHIIGNYHKATGQTVDEAIETALEAKEQWCQASWQQRASIFLRAAELIAGPYRAKINAATMLAQSKNVYQAEIDAACELIDFLRFNAYYMYEIYKNQPLSTTTVWNSVSYRPLEGFVYAIAPFNFTAISGNLPASAAIMGNVTIWKPSDYQIYSAKIIMDVFTEAGLPAGVINMVIGDAEMITEKLLASPHFAGVHYTGSTSVFKQIWKTIGNNIEQYKSYPRVVGETGGKGFIIAHPSSNIPALATAIVRGGFEFQGQKCSAASRIYLPQSIADEVIALAKNNLNEINVGSPEDPTNFITAMIHEKAYKRIVEAIERVKKDEEATILFGGTYSNKEGYFIEPTLIQTSNPNYFSMEQELFGPLVTIYVYPDKQWNETLKLIDNTSDYALTGAVFSEDSYATQHALNALENSAGNFYINDKPTGAVVGHQPFGGSRNSGTNDKAGSAANLVRWTSPRLIKEVFVPDTDYRYPFLES